MADLKNTDVHEELSPKSKLPGIKPADTYPLTGVKDQPMRVTSYEKLGDRMKGAVQEEELHWAVEAARSGQQKPYSDAMTPGANDNEADIPKRTEQPPGAGPTPNADEPV